MNNTTSLIFRQKGMTQAGFFPSVVIYFSLWYRKRDQTMRIAIIFGAAIISSALSGILVCTYRFHKVRETYYKFRHMFSHIWMVFVV